MAGDIGTRERRLRVEEAASSDATIRSIEEVDCRPLHVYDRLVIAEVPPAADETLAASALVEMEELSEDDDLNGTERLGAEAFEMRASDEYVEAKGQRPHDGEPWDTDEALSPHPPETPDDLEAAGAMALAAAPTSARLTGKVAVGIVIVEGPTAPLKFSSAERTKVVAEVQNGLGWLGGYSSPAGVSWHYDIHVVSLDVQPGPDTLTSAQKEARWRDPAMAKLGFGAGMGGVQDYVNALRSSKQTNWAYCAFFTKYPVGWFAYASLGGPRLVMDYGNDGWGPDNIDRVFAHETGHIFNAPDEYAGSGCNCGGQWGFYKVKNGNCENCASGGGVACIMKSNSWEMCGYTPYHLGFPQEERYDGVYVQGSGSHGLWVNASWPHFVTKWQEWSGEGLRLIDLEISQIGRQYRYSGVFRQGSGGHGLWVNASWSSFVAKWQEWSRAGLRLIDLEIEKVGTQWRYSGVFRQGSGAHGLWVNASWSSFVDKWQEWSGKGLRLIDLEITRIGTQWRYSGVFEQGGGAHGLWVNANWSSFADRWRQWSNQGLRLIDLERIRVGNQWRYSGVFRQGSGGYGLWVNANWSSFYHQWKTWSEGGLRLIDFEVLPPGATSSSEPAGSAESTADDGQGFGSAFSEEEDSAAEEGGFGQLMLDSDPAGGKGVGSGAHSLAGGVDEGAGFGVSSLDALDGDTEPNAPDDGAGFGVSSLDEDESTDAEAPGEAGFGVAEF